MLVNLLVVGGDSIAVKYSNYIIIYQKHMGGVDHKNQNRFIGIGFKNVAHFKNWYKKYVLGGFWV